MPPPSPPPPPPADKLALASAENPSLWRYIWEAQSHTPTLRLLIFNPKTKPLDQCRDLKFKLFPEQSLLAVSFSKSEENLAEISFLVPVPRVLLDPEASLHFRAFDDHIEVKLVLLLPVDHPLVSDFDTILNSEISDDELHPISLDSDVNKLSCMKEVHFYCSSCSAKLTKGLRCFQEMPSVNWRDAADNWFGNCCCSFGGLSEKLVAKYVSSYACEQGVCLLSTTSVLLCKNDILGCEFPDVKPRQNFESNQSPLSDSCLSRVSPDEVCDQVQKNCCGDQDKGVAEKTINSSHTEHIIAGNSEFETSEVVNGDCLSFAFPALKIEESIEFANGASGLSKHDNGCCAGDVLGTSSTVVTAELLENQKVFMDGFLGSGFMVRSCALSKDIHWNEFLCPQCSCLVGAYPYVEDGVPLDGGVRLFKCYVSTSLPYNRSNDAFRKYTLERMFTNQLLESAEDELSFRTIVRDIITKSPMLQIVLLNPNSWCYTGSVDPTEPAVSKLVMYPTVKLLYSICGPEMEVNSKSVEEWVKENEADEVYMFSSQIMELIRTLDSNNSFMPPLSGSLQGLLLSSMKR